MQGVDYLSQATPPDYKCGKCGASGVKLWREYQTPNPILFCAACAAADQDVYITGIDQNGKFVNIDGVYTDNIDWLVPAVPDEEGDGFWGLTTVPPKGVAWWRSLPTQAKPKPIISHID